MIKDGIFKAVCLPLFAIAFPWASGMFCCPAPHAVKIIGTVAFFALLFFIVWQTTAKIVAKGRNHAWLAPSFSRKIFVLCGLAGLNGFVWSLAGAALWQQAVLQLHHPLAVYVCGLFYAIAAMGLVPLYEALFLSKERELDVKIVDQLDHERVQAELAALKAELDPHFIFNALTTISHLTSTAPQTAQAFTQKLAQVYKYFLINKDRELISLHEELKFIEDYFYLLQIRYDNGVRLQLHLNGFPETAMILPSSLQLLVENAIKHNHFSDKQPLTITINVAANSVTVSNELRGKPYAVESTRIGLLHLHQHYKLLCNKDIAIDETGGQFAVTVPLIKNSKP